MSVKLSNRLVCLCIAIGLVLFMLIGCAFLGADDYTNSQLEGFNVRPLSLTEDETAWLEMRNAIGICSYIAEHHQHGYTHDNLTTEELVDMLLAGEEVETMCGWIARAAMVLLEKAGFETRLVSMNSAVQCSGHTQLEVVVAGEWRYADITFDMLPMGPDGEWLNLSEFSDAVYNDDEWSIEWLDCSPEMPVEYLIDAVEVPMHYDGSGWWYSREDCIDHMTSCAGGNSWSYMPRPEWLYEYYGEGMPDPETGDLLDEDFSSISDWVDADYAQGVSEVSPAGQLRLDTNAALGGSNFARRTRDIGSYPDEFTLEIMVYANDIGTKADGEHFSFFCAQADEGIFAVWDGSSLVIQDTDSGFTEVGTDLVKSGSAAEWQTWRFLVTFTGTTGEGTCDVYLDDSAHSWEKVGTEINCSFETTAFDDGFTWLDQEGITSNDMVSHVDYLEISSGIEE